jgi:hypothetical protein
MALRLAEASKWHYVLITVSALTAANMDYLK